MAGAIKHMERSHRSHRKNQNIYAGFHRHAYAVAEAKVKKATIGQRLASMLSPLKKKLTQATSNK